MYDDHPRPRAATQERRARPATPRAGRSPDRVALWAVFMAVIAMVAAAASSAEGSGGVGLGGGEREGGCDDARFGQRQLSRGDCGSDVKTLNWILNSKRYANSAPMGDDFKGRTENSVETFQRRKGLADDGVVNGRTERKIVRSMRKSVATWYGPGFYGNRTACGQRLRRKTVGVAHKRLPCGTKVTVRYKGRFLRTRVIDRGPYAHGASWDLTSRAAKKLRFETTDTVRAAAVK